MPLSEQPASNVNKPVSKLPTMTKLPTPGQRRIPQPGVTKRKLPGSEVCTVNCGLYSFVPKFSFVNDISDICVANIIMESIASSVSQYKLYHDRVYSLGAGNYHQPQLPSANMADSVVGTERYSLFMQKLSTHFGVWGLYMTEYHVCTYCTPPFDLRVATFAARRWGKKRQADGNLQFSKQRMMVIAPLLWW